MPKCYVIKQTEKDTQRVFIAFFEYGKYAFHGFSSKFNSLGEATFSPYGKRICKRRRVPPNNCKLRLSNFVVIGKSKAVGRKNDKKGDQIFQTEP